MGPSACDLNRQRSSKSVIYSVKRVLLGAARRGKGVGNLGLLCLSISFTNDITSRVCRKLSTLFFSDFQWFLIALSVRPFSNFAMSAHLLPAWWVWVWARSGHGEEVRSAH